MGTISHLPRRDRPQPVRLPTELEAERAIDALVASWEQAQSGGLAERRESLKLSGLTTISLAAGSGGLDCSNRLLVLGVRRLQAVDPGAAEALHRHFVMIEHFRALDDERFYEQLAGQVLAGDLFFCETSATQGVLAIRQEDFQATASGSLLLNQSALWADWLWVFSRNEVAGQLLDGAVLIPARAGVFESVTGRKGSVHLSVRFRAAPVAQGQWGHQAQGWKTSIALDHLLEAARASERLASVLGRGPVSGAALRVDVALAALLALVSEAASLLDQAQVSSTASARAQAGIFCLKAAQFAADLSGDEARFEQLARLRADLPSL